MALAHDSVGLVMLASGLPEGAGFEIAFLISAAGAVIAAGSVLLIPGRSAQPAPEMRARTTVNA